MFEIFLVMFASFAPAYSAELVSAGVGSVRGQVVTSREVQIDQLLEQVLAEGDAKSKAKPTLLALDSKAFGLALQQILLQSAIALEARNFNVVQVSPEEEAAAEKRASAQLKGIRAWKDLQVLPKELETAIRRKLQARKFIQFRAQSSVLPVTDMEAQRYFNENRLKFGNLPFENFKEDIKSLLSRTQVERRLKDWYELLLNKYQAKNLIAEM